MNKLSWLVLLLLCASCENDYNRGYNEGYKQGNKDGYYQGYDGGKKEGYNSGFQKGINEGITKGYEKGKLDGVDSGYNLGYTDGFNKQHSTLNLSSIKSDYFSEKSLVYFTYGFYFIFIITLLAMLLSRFIFEKENAFILAKSLTLIIALGVAFLSMKMIGIDNFIYYRISGVIGWGIILSFIPFAWISSKFIFKLISSKSINNDILVIVIATILLYYFSLFLTDIKLYLVDNQFFSLCIISLAIGCLAFVVTKTISDNTKTRPSSA